MIYRLTSLAEQKEKYIQLAATSRCYLKLTENYCDKKALIVLYSSPDILYVRDIGSQDLILGDDSSGNQEQMGSGKQGPD